MIKNRSAQLMYFYAYRPWCSMLRCPRSTVILSQRGLPPYSSPALLVAINLLLNNTWMWTAFQVCCWTCTCIFFFFCLKWNGLWLQLVSLRLTRGLKQTWLLAEPSKSKSCESSYLMWINTIICHDNSICFKYQVIGSSFSYVYYQVFKSLFWD